MRGHRYVYNLEVEGLHTYVANRFVVHNCHHAPSSMHRLVLDALANPDTLILGLTATPNRSDGKALSEVFERISYTYLLPDAIADGYLVDLEGYSVHLDLDLDQLQTGKDGDFQQGGLQRAMMQPEVVDATVQAWCDHAQGLRTVAFGVQVEHADALSAAFRARGVAADYVHGGMAHEARKERYRALAAGELTVLCNVAVLTEGFDEPSIEAVLLARPTASQALYTQIVGRGARLFPGKRRCVVVDVTGTSSRLSLQTLPMLGGFPSPVEADTEVREAVDRVVERDGRVEHCPSLLRASREARRVDLLRAPRGQRYEWTQTQYGAALSVGRAGLFLVAPEPGRQGLSRVAHLQELPGVPGAAPGVEHAYRIELVGEGIHTRDAIGLAEAEARRFSPRRRQAGASTDVGPADPEAVVRALADVRARHRQLERQAGHSLPRGAAVAAAPALLRYLRRQREMSDTEAAALTRHEVEQMLRGGEMPGRVRGVA